MGKALVLGGTRFFGRSLVEALLQRGMEVTVATRGNTPDPFGDRVSRVTFDRNNFENFKAAFEGTEWDIVFDQICYSSQEAKEAVEVFTGNTQRYVLTSTMSVYNVTGKALKEEEYDPFTYKIEVKGKEEGTYQEGKRQAEAVFFQESPFSVAAVRFPIVLGKNDYTERLKFHVDRVANGESIYFSNIDSSFGYVSEEEAGEFLAWIGTSSFEGPVNTCATGTLTLRELMSLIEEKTGKTFVLAEEKTEDNESPYNIPDSWYMSNERGKNLGFPFSNLTDWLPGLVEYLAEKQRVQQ